jgi:hypothetical protein
MTHDELYERAEKAITEVFSDTSVSPQQTETDLIALIEHAEILISTLPKEIAPDEQLDS